MTERDAICNDRLFAALLYSIMKGKMSPLYSDWLSQELLSCVSNAWSSLGMNEDMKRSGGGGGPRSNARGWPAQHELRAQTAQTALASEVP